MLQIYFDDYLLDSKWVRSLTQQASSFDSQFKLGSTICRAFELEIDKRVDAYIEKVIETESYEELETESLELLLARLKETIGDYKPNKIYLKEDGTTFATLYVDDLDDNENAYYKYSLVDEMVNLNKTFDYDITTSHSTKALVETICTNHGISLVTQSFYMDDLMINWNQEDMTERDFISYVAEVNGGYAYINADGNLVIQTYSQTSSKTIPVEECSSFKLGTYHLIDRVYVELASATKYYPDTTENETVYLNSDNILLTDSGSYTIDGIIKHIQATINGFNFYNIKVDRCPIDGDVLCGNLITFTLNDNSYNTIAQIDLTYGGSWYGGYELELDSAEQQETQVKDSTKKAVREMKIVVDRELGEIKEEIKQTEDQFIDSIVPLFAQAIPSEGIPDDNQFSTTFPEYERNTYIYVMFHITYKSKREIFTDKQRLDDFVYYTSATSIFKTIAKNTTPDKPTEEVTINDKTQQNVWNLAVPTGTTDYNFYYFSVQYLSDSTYTWNTPIYIGAYNNGSVDVTASLNLYVKKAEGSDYIASWINACADNIVLNAKSSLVFGDLDNQYITISNYTNSSGTKIGVLFDGTGAIQMKPEGLFDIQNVYSGTLYNEFWMSRNANEGTGNTIVFSNKDINGKTANFQKYGANSTFNSTYGYTNSFAQQNYCYANPSYTANYINFISSSDDSEKSPSSYTSRNAMFITNKQYASSNNANSISLSYYSSGTSCTIYNYQKDYTYASNYISMSNNSSASYSQALMKNLKVGTAIDANSVSLYSGSSMTSSGMYNRQFGYDLDANALYMYSNSTKNNLTFWNYEFGTNVIQNMITLQSSTNSDDCIMKLTNFTSTGIGYNRITLSNTNLVITGCEDVRMASTGSGQTQIGSAYVVVGKDSSGNKVSGAVTLYAPSAFYFIQGEGDEAICTRMLISSSGQPSWERWYKWDYRVITG